MRTEVAVAGLDLSLRGAGAVVIPSGWELGDWSRVERAQVGLSLPRDADVAEQVHRLSSVALSLEAFVCERGVRDVWVEEYAFASKGRAHALGELGGVCKVRLVTRDCTVRVVTESQARKYLLGKLPARDRKIVTHQFLYEIGAPHDWTGDELDAFVVANWGRSELGLPAFSMGEAA